MGGTRISIDWVSAAIFVVTYAFMQVNAVPLRVRYVVMALGCGGIFAYRFDHYGQASPNIYITVAAAGLALYYLVKAFMARTPGSRGA